jgi:hypothetical protein
MKAITKNLGIIRSITKSDAVRGRVNTIHGNLELLDEQKAEWLARVQKIYEPLKLQERVLLDVLERAGLTGPDQSHPATVRVKHGQNRRGKTLHYDLNYSVDSQTFD